MSIIKYTGLRLTFLSQNRKKITVAIIPGDGIGPEVIAATLNVLDAVQEVEPKIQLNYVYADAGLSAITKYGSSLPSHTVQLLQDSICCLKGPVTTPEAPDSPKSAVIQIRSLFDLYANIRPIKARPNVPAIDPLIDMVIVRENTEGLYSGIEYQLNPESAIAIRVITKPKCERIVKYAFQLARNRRRKLTYVHKGNILKVTESIFKDAVHKYSKEYPEVTVTEARVDAMAMWLLRNPADFDVVVTTNLFGDILSDEAAQTVGGLGVVPGANIGETYAMFEPIHGSAPQFAGKDVVNPIATILSSKMMLDWLGFEHGGKMIEDAVTKVLKDQNYLTFDLAPPNVTPVKCSTLGQHIAKTIISNNT
jgi:isopropylmalate/isohomocitrate dehydrogenase-like protein